MQRTRPFIKLSNELLADFIAGQLEIQNPPNLTMSRGKIVAIHYDEKGRSISVTLKRFITESLVGWPIRIEETTETKHLELDATHPITFRSEDDERIFVDIDKEGILIFSPPGFMRANCRRVPMVEVPGNPFTLLRSFIPDVEISGATPPQQVATA